MPQTLDSINTLMKPRSIAVIGASEEKNSVGHGLLKSLISGGVRQTNQSTGFSGKIYAINPNHDTILGLKTHASILHVSQPIDVAVIAVPAKTVPRVLNECGEKKVKAAIIVSAGFAEIGGNGVQLQNQVIQTARKNNIRILGPNVLGLIRPPYNYNASFAISSPPPGEVGFITQSGALADSVIDWAIKERYAFSALVSLGNSADLDAADFIEWLNTDKHTKTIALYLEGLREGRKFMQAVKKSSKPVVLLKGGQTESGTKAVSSHTASLAGSPRVFHSAMQQCGAIWAQTVEELFDLAKTLAEQPHAQANSVAIVTNGGGAGVLCADYCHELGVNLVELKPSTIKKLDASGVMHPAYSRRNPLDLIGDALPERYEVAINTLLAEPYIHGLIVIQTLQTMTNSLEDARIVINARRKYTNKPIVCVFMGGAFSQKSIDLLHSHGVPDYNDPRKAVKAMSVLVNTKN